MKHLSFRIFLSAIIILISLFLTYFLCVLGWLSQINILPYSFLSAFILTTIILFSLKNYLNIERKDYFLSTFIAIVVLILSSTISLFFYDQSFDGQWYHQMAIHHLASQWNPTINPNTTESIYVGYYPKAMETISAAIVSLFDEMEMGKAINLLFIFVLWGYSLKFCENFFSNLKNKIKYLLSIVICLCPVSAYQCFTYYIDYIGYVFFVIVLICLYFIEINKKTNIKNNILEFATLSVIVSLSIAIKLNIAFWIILSLTIYLITLIIRKKYLLMKTSIVVGICSILFGIFVLGFNPYVTNIQNGNALLYPLIGENKEDILTANTPQVLLNENRFKQIWLSYSHRPSEYKLYRSITKIWDGHKSEMTHSDNRIGGFGAFFIEIFVMAVILILLSNKQNRKAFFILLSLEIFLLSSLLLVQGGWWARYVPFFYLFVLLPLLYVFKYSMHFKIIKYVVLVLIVYNFAFHFHLCAKKSHRYKYTIEHTLKEFENNQPIHLKSTNFGIRYKMEKHKINYIEDGKADKMIDGIWPPVYVLK